MLFGISKFEWLAFHLMKWLLRKTVEIALKIIKIAQINAGTWTIRDLKIQHDSVVSSAQIWAFLGIQLGQSSDNWHNSNALQVGPMICPLSEQAFSKIHVQELQLHAHDMQEKKIVLGEHGTSELDDFALCNSSLLACCLSLLWKTSPFLCHLSIIQEITRQYSNIFFYSFHISMSVVTSYCHFTQKKSRYWEVSAVGPPTGLRADCLWTLYFFVIVFIELYFFHFPSSLSLPSYPLSLSPCS